MEARMTWKLERNAEINSRNRRKSRWCFLLLCLGWLLLAIILFSPLLLTQQG